MDKETLSYEKAYKELQSIIEEMENKEISIDILSDKIKRALFLIGICKDKLSKIEVDVDKLIKTIKDNVE
jgi:exodeoxyribonuclease VII small subunit